MERLKKAIRRLHKQRVLAKPPKSVLKEQWPGGVRQWYDPRKEVI
ncbi:hypothetical protein COLO4_37565 [Corchorus olitorius]|uniref:Uncharacterized protein n=1 Tax=Corchorus olitorius TaxID=93759 RepID=A0A1R3G0V3_9ROSI|nr:hypothetical protein COLO4_37565 [Corchorus olitorius]